MHKSNRNALLGGVAGVATIAALAFTSASGTSGGGGGGLMPAAGGAGTPTATVAPSETSAPSEVADNTGTATDSPSDDSTSSTSETPKPTKTATPTPSAPSTTRSPTSDPDDGYNWGKLGPKPGQQSVSNAHQDGSAIKAYAGYCTAAQSMEHLRSSSVIVWVAPDDYDAGVRTYLLRVEGAGKGTRAYEQISAGQKKIGPIPLQWTGTSDNFRIVLYAVKVDGTRTQKLSVSADSDPRFASIASRWCDGKAGGADQGGSGQGGDSDHGGDTTPPSARPTGPKVQAG